MSALTRIPSSKREINHSQTYPHPAPHPHHIWHHIHTTTTRSAPYPQQRQIHIHTHSHHNTSHLQTRGASSGWFGGRCRKKLHGRFASDGGSGSLFSSIHDVSCGSFVVAFDVVRLFANDWVALLETKGHLQVRTLLQTSVVVASSTRRDEALVQC